MAKWLTVLQILGTLPSAASLPATFTEREAGLGYLVLDTGHLWVWDGRAWIDLGARAQAPAPQGAAYLLWDEIPTLTLFGARVVQDSPTVQWDLRESRIARATVPPTAFMPTDPLLVSLAALVTSANTMPYFTGQDQATVTALTPFARQLLDDPDAASMRATLGVSVSPDAWQPLDATLTALAGLATTADTFPTFSGIDQAALAPLTPLGKTLLAQSTATNMQSVLALVPGVTIQAQDPALQALAELALGANTLLYVPAVDTLGLTPLTPFARTLLDDADAATMRATLQIPEGGTLWQPLDATLTALASLSATGNQVAYFTGADQVALAPLTPYARTVLDDADAATARTTLGLGGLATLSSVTTTQINDGAVTYAKIQNVSSFRLVGRYAAGAGVLQEIQVGAGLTLDVTGVLSASATAAYTDEQAQDAVGAMLLDTATIDLTYVDTTPSLSADVKDGSITYPKMQNVSATDRLLGRSSAGAGGVEEILCTAAGRALLDDADAAAQRATLGLGSMALQSHTAVYAEKLGIFVTATYPLDVNGNVHLFGGTIGIGVNPSIYPLFLKWTKGTTHGIAMQPLDLDSGSGNMVFMNLAGTVVGSIFSTAVGTTFNTTSDARLKDAVETLTGAEAVIQALRPVAFRWKTDGSPGVGFLADEVQAVMPAGGVVTGTPDAVDAEGHLIPMGMDASKLVPYLTAAVQGLLARVATLEARA